MESGECLFSIHPLYKHTIREKEWSKPKFFIKIDEHEREKIWGKFFFYVALHTSQGEFTSSSSPLFFLPPQITFPCCHKCPTVKQFSTHSTRIHKLTHTHTKSTEKNNQSKSTQAEWALKTSGADSCKYLRIIYQAFFSTPSLPLPLSLFYCWCCDWSLALIFSLSVF